MHHVESSAGRRISFGDRACTIQDVVDLAHRRAVAELSSDPAVRARLQRGADFVDRLLAEDGVIYGVTTGYGDSCTVVVPPDLVDELPERLFTYHGCGLGEYLTPEQTRAVMVTRLCSLAKGFSGVSLRLLEQLVALLQHISCH
jgi:histidine ammonia-lyase